MRWTCSFLPFLLVGCVSGTSLEPGDLTVVAPRAPSAVVAFRDGDRDWVVATGADSPLTFRVTSGEYTVAIGCPDIPGARGGHVDVYQMRLDDLASLPYDQDCDASPPDATLSGSVAGFPTDGNQSGFEVRWGVRSVFLVHDVDHYGFAARAGRRDLIATRGAVVADRLLLIRDLPVLSDATQPIDFASPATIALVYQPIEGGQAGYLQNYFFSAGGTAVTLGAFQDSVLAVPASAMGEGDLQRVDIAGRRGPGYGQIFTTAHISRAPCTSIDLVGPVFEHPVVTGVLRGGVVDLHARWSPQADATLYDLYIGKWSVHASPAALEADGMTVPDLSGVPGWDDSFALPASSTDWAMSVTTVATLDDALRTLPVHEGEIRRSGWTGFVSP